MQDELFSVCQFFMNGQYEYVRRYVSDREAVTAFKHYITSVGAQIGTTVRVIIVDIGDCINMEWQYQKGIVYPPDFQKGTNNASQKRESDS